MLAALHLNQAEGRGKDDPDLVAEVQALREALASPPPLVRAPQVGAVECAIYADGDEEEDGDLAKRVTAKRWLELAVCMALEGQVLFREQFFRSASDKVILRGSGSGSGSDFGWEWVRIGSGSKCYGLTIEVCLAPTAPRSLPSVHRGD